MIHRTKYGRHVVLSPGDKWQCIGCSRVHGLDGYTAAHWGDELFHECQCGIKRFLCRGVLTTPIWRRGLSKEEITAEVFRVVRNLQDQKPEEIVKALKEHIPQASEEQLKTAIASLIKKY